MRAWREATGFCREKLAVLARGQGLKVSPSTIHRYLKRAGLVRPSTKRRRPLFQNGRVMRPRNCPGLGYLQMDVKYVTPELSGLSYTCYLYAAMDIYSRYKVGLIHYPSWMREGLCWPCITPQCSSHSPCAMSRLITGWSFRAGSMRSVHRWGWSISTSTRALPMRMQSSRVASEPMKRNASSAWTIPHKTTFNSIPGTNPTYTPTILSVPIWVSICLPLRRLSTCTRSLERLRKTKLRHDFFSTC